MGVRKLSVLVPNLYHSSSSLVISINSVGLHVTPNVVCCLGDSSGRGGGVGVGLH